MAPRHRPRRCPPCVGTDPQDGRHSDGARCAPRRPGYVQGRQRAARCGPSGDSHAGDRALPAGHRRPAGSPRPTTPTERPAARRGPRLDDLLRRTATGPPRRPASRDTLTVLGAHDLPCAPSRLPSPSGRRRGGPRRSPDSRRASGLRVYSKGEHVRRREGHVDRHVHGRPSGSAAPRRARGCTAYGQFGTSADGATPSASSDDSSAHVPGRPGRRGSPRRGGRAARRTRPPHGALPARAQGVNRGASTSTARWRVQTTCVPGGADRWATRPLAVRGAPQPDHGAARTRDAICKVDGLPRRRRLPGHAADRRLLGPVLVRRGSGAGATPQGVDSLNVPDGGSVAFAWQNGGGTDAPGVPAGVTRRARPSDAADQDAPGGATTAAEATTARQGRSRVARRTADVRAERRTVRLAVAPPAKADRRTSPAA